MKKLKNKQGMTMAEMLIVVAIVVILAALAFVAVWNYQRSLGQVERDGIAKEIFVAAQNHLTVSYGEGYMGVTDFGTEGTAEGDSEKSIYYFTVYNTISDSSLLGRMLPFGAIDETVRKGGSYIVRYQKSTGLVLDVFYCTMSGSPTVYNHQLQSDEYQSVLDLRDTATENNKLKRRNWNGAILGWYGGTEAAALPTVELTTPTIRVVNAEKLYVEVTNPNDSIGNAKLKLIVTGVDSKAQKAYELTESDVRIQYNSTRKIYTVVLDDITNVTNDTMHFCNIQADTSNQFIPGENIEIQAVAYSTQALANVAYSQKSLTNSLFGSINARQDTAYIANIRHLENLDQAISDLDRNDGIGANEKLKIRAAEQTDDFGWPAFQKAIRQIEKNASGIDLLTADASVAVTEYSGSNTSVNGTGYFMPIQPQYELSYDGKGHRISEVRVNRSGAAGLFGAASTVSEIKNLELMDFSILGTSSAGALAGTLQNCSVTNVLARNSTNQAGVNVSAASGAAGGLIGTIQGTVQYSAAAVTVHGDTVAGGLIGNASGSVVGCYSGGHTMNGSYESWVGASGHSYDVTGGTVGGLIGTGSNILISSSYSTCSASGSTAGGLAGSVNGTIANCYATGLVSGTTAQYAFLASGTATLTGNAFYSGVNQVPKTGGKEGEMDPVPPVDGYALDTENMAKVKPLDLNADSYNSFVGAYDTWNTARVYDASLMRYYGGRYCLRTVDELNSTLPDGLSWNELFVVTHYGDWPSPEVFFINNT